MSSIELFSAAHNSWAHTTDIPGNARLGIAAGVVGDALILVGGYDKKGSEDASDISDAVERFDILTKRCRTVQHLEFVSRLTVDEVKFH